MQKAMRKYFLLFLGFSLLFSCEENNNSIQEIAIQGDSSKTDDVSPQTPTEMQRIKTISDSFEDYCAFDEKTSSLGIGLVIAPEKLVLYEDSSLLNEFMNCDMNSGDVKRKKICCKFFKPDYGIMHFVCLDETALSYKVLINYDEVKYLPKSYAFKTWEDYILESFGIRRILPEENPNEPILSLHKLPNVHSESLALPKGHELFCPMKVEGDWAKVKYDCFYNNENNDHEGEPCYSYIKECKEPLVGWLRWKQNNKLLIDIFLMP
ncbi:MAG: hypothetical protein JWO58_1319 [Chitinophagaceae bacterium]|nr:hypothetical protein [Chitinophagaceae bacterium]